jgi:hypothetical protein
MKARVHEAARGLVGEARGSDARGSVACSRLMRARSLVARGWWLDRWVQVMDLDPLA